MTNTLQLIRERINSSLFIVPAAYVVAGILLAQLMLWVDGNATSPAAFAATVEGARAILTTIAAATVTFASIAFSVSLLLISSASTQYSPRVVHRLFRDPFNVRVMGIVVGTFSYCLLVLRSVRGPLESGGDATIPSYSITVALALGLVSILALVGFISHSAHSMDVSKILDAVTDESIAAVKRSWSDTPSGAGDRSAPEHSADALAIDFDKHGWIEYIDHEKLLKVLPPGTTLLLDTVAGRYAIPGTAIGWVWPKPNDAQWVQTKIRAAVQIGETRTMQQDAAFGIRQLSDVALRALSPSTNDPTTARDSILHMAAVLSVMFQRVPPPRQITGTEERVIWSPHEPDYPQVIELAFDEVRIAGQAQPVFSAQLLVILHDLDQVASATRPSAQPAIKRQAHLLVEAFGPGRPPSEDNENVRETYARYFQ